MALALVIGLVGGAEVWRSYLQAVGAAERQATDLTQLLAEQAERSIQAIDLTLIGISDALRVAPGLVPNDPAFHEAMIRRLQHMPYVRGLFVIDRDGIIVHDTRFPVTPERNVSDRAYFNVHQEIDGDSLYISRPLRSRTADTWFVGLSRRLANADGSFGGVVAAAVEPRYFERFYEGLSPGEDNMIALLLRDGSLLVRTPDHEEMIGHAYPNSKALKLALTQGTGVAWTVSPVDKVMRLVGYRPLASGSVVVLAGLSESFVFAAWRNHAIVVAGGSALVWLLTAGLAIVSHRCRRRAHQERARLTQRQRLETMGRIAGGVAHDLGNTIKIARTTFSLVKPALVCQSDALALVEDADRALKNTFEIIDRLLAFARRQELSPRPTDLAELIDGFAPILRQAAGPDIELVLDLAKPLVCAIDPIHLESALLNLVLNSKDAMPNGGRIVVELRDVQPPKRRRRGSPVAAGRPWAEIAIKDTGAGMPRDVVDRAFEPFFTTKANGSGLGLSQVLGFVQQSAGEVRIESRETHGTTVRLLFPTTAPADMPP